MNASNSEEPGRTYRAQEDRLIPELLRSVPAAWPKDWARKAFDRLVGRRTIPEQEEPFFGAWLFWNAEPRPGVTAGSVFRKRKGAELPEISRRWLDAQIDGWMTIVEILSLKPGVGIRVRDTLTGDEHFVSDRAGSRSARPRMHLLTRLVKFEGATFFACCYSQALPPEQGHLAAEDVRAAMGIKGADEYVGAESLRSEEATSLLVEIWELEIETLARMPAPRLLNTDGDELLITRDRFDFAPGNRKAVIAALRDIPCSSAERVHARDLSMIEFSAGKGKKRVLLGTAEVRADRVLATSNSLRRADELRSSIETACGTFVRHRVRDHQDPQAALAQRDPDAPAPPRKPAPPQVVAALVAYKAEHYRTWPDVPLPALKGKTPRKAITTAAGRREVELLLAQLEYVEANFPEAERFDVGILRRTLGLSKDP